MADATSTVRIVVDRTQADQQIRDLNNQLANVGKSAGNASTGFNNLGNSARSMGNALKGANDNAKEAHRSFGFLHEVLMGIAFGAGIGIIRTFEDIGRVISDTVKDAFKAAASFDTLRASLGTATGSMAAGVEKFKELQEWARKTPFAIDDVTRAYTTLTNAGLNNSAKAMAAWGNLATAQNKSLTEMTHDIMLASEGGPKAFKAFGISAKAEGDKIRLVYRGMVTEIANNSSAIQKYFYDLANNHFGDAMAFQMDTVAGASKRMHEAWEEALAAFGAGFTGSFTRLADSMEKGADSTNHFATSFGKLAGSVFGGLVTTVKAVTDHIGALAAALVGYLLPATIALVRETALAIASEVAYAVALGRAMMAVEGLTVAQAALTVGTAAAAEMGGALLAAIGGWPVVLAAAAAGLYLLLTREDDSTKATKDLQQATQDLNELLKDPSATDAAIKNQEKLTQQRLRDALATRQQLDAQLQLAQQNYKQDSTGGRGKAGLEMAGADALRVQAMQDQINQNNAAIEEAKKQIFGAEYKTITGKTYGMENIDRPGEGLNFGTAPSNVAQNLVSPQQAIKLYGLGLQSQGLKVSENPNFGGVTAGVHRGQGHADGRAIDVNAVAGSDASVAWANAKDTAIAMDAASKGFIALFNHTRYASDGSGGFTTSAIPKGQDQHTSHLHVEAKGSVDASGLTAEPQSRLTMANQLEQKAKEQAKALATANTTYDQLIGKTTEEGAAENVRAKALADISEKVKNTYTDSQGQLLISKEELATKTAQAVKQKELAIDQAAGRAADERHAQRVQDLLPIQAEIADLMAGNKVASTKMAEDAQVQLAVDKEKSALEKEGMDTNSAIAKSKLAIAAADKQSEISLGKQRDALKEIKDLALTSRQNVADRALSNGDSSLSLGLENDKNSKLIQQEMDRFNLLSEEEKKKELADHNIILRDYREQHFAAIADIANALRDNLSEAAQKVGDALAQIIGGSTGDKVGGVVKGIGSILSIFKASSSFGTGEGKAPWSSYTSGPNAGPLSSVLDGLNKAVTSNSGTLDKIFGSGANGSGGFSSTLSSALGKASAGAGIGAATVPIGQAIWSRYSATGAQIGGAIGSFIPIPGGQIIGSIAGGIIGGLLTKPAKASASVSFDPLTGQMKAGTAVGSSKNIGDAQNAANSITSGINSIVGSLGATLTKGINLEVVKKKNYYINGEGIPYADAASAIADGILVSLKAGIASGAISGISDFSKRILQHATKDNLEGLVSVAANYEKLLKDLDALQNPLTAGVTEFSKTMDDLVKTMTAAGATTAELQNVQTYRELKLKQMLDQNLQGLKDFQKALSGDNSGLTDLTRLNTDLQKFQQMKTDMAGGKAVNPDDFTTLGQEIFQLAGNVYGTSTDAFQQIRGMLMDTTQSMIDKVTADFQPMIDAANQTTVAVNVGNNLLGQILGRLGGRLGDGTGGTGVSAANGVYNYSGVGSTY